MILKNLPEEAYLELMMDDNFALLIQYDLILGYIRVNPSAIMASKFFESQGQHYGVVLQLNDSIAVCGINVQSSGSYNLDQIEAIPDNSPVYQWGMYHFKFEFEKGSYVY